MTPQRGRFLTLEGVEGAGKTTCLERIVDVLGAHGIDALVTREPGGTTFGEALRALLLDPDHQGLHPDTETLALFSARAQHLHERILPALESGRWVVSDRFTDATYAYQGGGRGVEHSRIEVLEDWVQGGVKPDLTLLMDVSVEVGRARAAARGREGGQGSDRFEAEASAFFDRARQAYLERARLEPERFRILNAEQDAQAVADDAASAVRAFLGAQP